MKLKVDIMFKRFKANGTSIWSQRIHILFQQLTLKVFGGLKLKLIKKYGPSLSNVSTPIIVLLTVDRI